MTLCKGDTIDIIAPGYGVNPVHLQEAQKYIESIGLITHIPDNMLSDDTPYYSHHDSNRLEFLKDALYNRQSKAVWCIKGGYGSSRLMSELWKLKPPQDKKLLIGFSDITALHILLNQHWNWPSLHAPVLYQVIKKRVTDTSISVLENMLFGKETRINATLHSLNDSASSLEELTAPIAGGNLSILQTSMGTCWQFNPKDKIIFIEDVGEAAYSIDRMLTQLKQAGIFDHAKAVIIGDVTNTDNLNGENHLNYALSSFAESCKRPVFKCEHYGHEEYNYPLPLNIPATISVADNQATLHCHLGET